MKRIVCLLTLLVSSLVSMAQAPEEIVAKVKAAENKPVPKSKWQQRLEEAQKMQRQMEQQKKGRK